MPILVISSLSWLVGGVNAADRAQLQISFLSKVEAQKAIVAEKLELYFELMTALDMRAKVGKLMQGDTREQRIADCKKHYERAMLEFSDEEKAALTVILESLRPTFAKHYPLLLRTPWRFIKKSDSLESAAHFTREDCIVLSARYVIATAKKFKQVKDGSLDRKQFVRQAAMLLLHEQTHVLQRLHADRFTKLYAEHWQLIRAENIKDHSWLAARRAVNPDGVDIGWVHPLPSESDDKVRRYVWPQVIYKKTEGDVRLFRDTLMAAVEVEKTRDGFEVLLRDGQPVYQSLGKHPSLLQRYPFGGAYHPNEAAAGALPVVILHDFVGEVNAKTDERTRRREKERAKLKAWFRQILR